MKEKAPQCGAIPESEGDSSNRADYEEKNSTVVRFPAYHAPRFPAYHPPGFTRNCIRCGHRYHLPLMAAAIRDGREKVCPSCFVDRLKGVRL